MKANWVILPEIQTDLTGQCPMPQIIEVNVTIPDGFKPDGRMTDIGKTAYERAVVDLCENMYKLLIKFG